MKYLSKAKWIACVFAALASFSCSNDNTVQNKSMDELYSENGYPVQIRQVKAENFSVTLKFPAEYKARSESTAYAGISDIVREVHVKTSDRVKQNQVILTLSLDNASYRQAKAQLENAEVSYERIKSLYEKAGVSRQDFDNARTQYDIARGTLKQIQDLIEVKAPIDGTITRIDVSVSSNVQPGTFLFTVSNNDAYEANFYVLPDEIDSIRSGERAFIKTGAQRIEGCITDVSLSIDPLHRAFFVKAAFPEKVKSLASGMAVDVEVEVYSNPHAIVLTQKEMVKSGTDWFAYVVKGGRAERRKLVLGHREGISYMINDGIQANDELIIDGVQNLRDGEKIKLVSKE